MAGTILKSLSQMATSPQADGTVATAASTGFASISWGTGNTAVHDSAAKMGGTAGLTVTQGGTVQPLAYFDLDAAVSVFTFRIEVDFTSPILQFRGLSALDHVTNLWTLYFTAANAGKLQFTEGTSGGANLVSSGAVGSNVDFTLVGKIDTVNNTYAATAYQRGTTTVLSQVSGTLSTSGANTPVRSFRTVWGTSGTATGARVYLNNNFAIGQDDYLARTDIAAAALGVTLSGTGPSGPASSTSVTVNKGDVFTLSITPTGGTGGAVTYVVDWGDGTAIPAAPGTSPISRTHTYSVGGTFTITVTPYQ